MPFIYETVNVTSLLYHSDRFAVDQTGNGVIYMPSGERRAVSGFGIHILWVVINCETSNHRGMYAKRSASSFHTWCRLQGQMAFLPKQTWSERHGSYSVCICQQLPPTIEVFSLSTIKLLVHTPVVGREKRTVGPKTFNLAACAASSSVCNKGGISPAMPVL